MPGITWEEFVRCARDFVVKSDSIGDDWTLEGDLSLPGAAYLKKSHLRLDSHSQPVRWEYHVCYSLSYATPILLFVAHDPSGALLSGERIWRECNALYKCGDDPAEAYGAVTQREHPVTARPYYCVHPCRTEEFLGGDEGNAVIRFVSTVGPLIGLHLSNDYGK